MPLSFSNKVQKPLFDFNNLFGTANTTPAVSKTVAQQISQPSYAIAPNFVKAAPAKSTTPTAQTSTATYQGTPIKYGDQGSINTQIKAANGQAAGAALAPTNGVSGLVPAPTPTAQAAANPTFSGIIYDLIKKATDEDKAVSGARATAEDSNKRLQEQKAKVAATDAAIHQDPIPLEFQQGRSQVLQTQAASVLDALGQEFSGNTNLLNSAIDQRGQTLSALNSAAGLAQPAQAAFGQTTFDPLKGGFSGGGGLPPEVMQQYAQMAANGQYSAIPSFITSNPVLNAQLNVSAKAYNPNFNPVSAQGASGVLATIPALQSAETAASGIKNTITSYLDSNPQLNPSDLAAGNLLQQWIQGKQLTDPKYQTLFNYLNEYTNTLAPILGVGGDATNLKTQIAQSFVNGAASGQSITEVLNAIDQLAKNKVVDLQRGAIGQGTSVPQSGVGGFAEAW